MDTAADLQKNILDATLRVFDQKGLKFTMDDLAKEILLLFAAIPCAMDFSMANTAGSAQKSLFRKSLMTQMSLSILTLPLVLFLCRLLFPASL